MVSQLWRLMPDGDAPRGGRVARARRRRLLHPARRVPVVGGMASAGRWSTARRRLPPNACSRGISPPTICFTCKRRSASLIEPMTRDLRYRLRAVRGLGRQRPRRGRHHRGARGGVDRLGAADHAGHRRRGAGARARADRADAPIVGAHRRRPSGRSISSSCTCCSRASAPSRTSRSPAGSRSSRSASGTSSASSAPPSSAAPWSASRGAPGRRSHAHSQHADRGVPGDARRHAERATSCRCSRCSPTPASASCRRPIASC